MNENEWKVYLSLVCTTFVNDKCLYVNAFIFLSACMKRYRIKDRSAPVHMLFNQSLCKHAK